MIKNIICSISKAKDLSPHPRTYWPVEQNYCLPYLIAFKLINRVFNQELTMNWTNIKTPFKLICVKWLIQNTKYHTAQRTSENVEHKLGYQIDNCLYSQALFVSVDPYIKLHMEYFSVETISTIILNRRDAVSVMNDVFGSKDPWKILWDYRFDNYWRLYLRVTKRVNVGECHLL